MPLRQLSFSGHARYYLMRDIVPLPGRVALSQPEAVKRMEQVGSQRFFLDEVSGTLFKVREEKYAPDRRPLKWLLRDVIGSRLLWQYDGYREYRGNRVLVKAGLQTVHCRGFGMAVGLFNPLLSIYAMEYMPWAVSGQDYFETCSDSERVTLVQRMCEEALQLASFGYSYRDFHYGNFMIGADGTIIWIDTHVRRIPHGRQQQLASLENMLTASKLKGERYRQIAVDYFRLSYAEPA